MHATKKIERAGVDIRVALSSKTKILSTHLDATGGHAPKNDAAASPPAAATGFNLAVKRTLRPLARLLFKLIKPILRPLAFRLRAHLHGTLQVEAQQLRQSLAEELGAHKQLQLEAIERLLTVHTTQLVQEIQAMRVAARRTSSIAAPDVVMTERVAARLDRLEAQAQRAPYRLAVACGPDELMLRTAVGYVLCQASDYALISSLLENGELEPGTRMLIQKLLRPGDTFVDAGANIGMHTLAAARAMQGTGRIVAFEPHPVTHDLLRKSIWMNGFSDLVETRQAAVSDRAGAEHLYLGSTSGHHSLYPLELKLTVPPPLEVPLLRIDDILDESGKVDLMKIDVEGAELEALRGAKATIERNPGLALIVEFGISHLRRTGHGTAQWLGEFEKFGFAFSVIDPSDGTLRDASVEELESNVSVNLFLARPGAIAWHRARGTA